MKPMSIRQIKQADNKKAWKASVSAIPAPFKAMLDEWGPACPEYDPECFCCVAWAIFNGSTVPTTAEVMNEYSRLNGVWEEV